MDIEVLSVKLAELMIKETGLLDRISAEEEKLQEALRQSSWNDMELIINRLNPLSDSMEKTESERDAVYRKLKSLLGRSKEDGFYSVAMHMEGDTRENCLAAYRQMKISLLRMQGVTAGINQYVRAVGDTSRTVLEEVFPHRKGRLYCNRGCEKPVQADPMILNRHL